MSGHEHLSKADRRQVRRLERLDRASRRRDEMIVAVKEIAEYHRTPDVKPLQALTEAQGHYILTIKSKQVTFGLGPAGTGKTYVAAAMAANAIKEGLVEKIIITRPAIEAEESLGFIPGDLDEKYEPYIAPVKAVLQEQLGKGPFEYMLKSKKIEAMPLGFLRGHTLKNCWVLFDEAQNSTPGQMKMFLTRIGQNSKVIINGDATQKDFNGYSGLEDAYARLRNSAYVGVVEFEISDIVRSGFVREVLLAYAA